MFLSGVIATGCNHERELAQVHLLPIELGGGGARRRRGSERSKLSLVFALLSSTLVNHRGIKASGQVHGRLPASWTATAPVSNEWLKRKAVVLAIEPNNELAHDNECQL